MPERPLLIFPSPTSVNRFKKKGGSDGKPFSKPTREQQIQRIEPQFQLLENAFQTRRVQLQSDVSGTDPEMVLVFETRGTIEDFFKAVNKIPELEWLGEVEKEFQADSNFHFEDPNKEIRGRLFFVMSNHAALRQLKSLWDNYYKPNIKFKIGTTKWRDLFALLYDVRLWGLMDRVRETGLLEDWQYRLNHTQDTIPFEIELWYRNSASDRERIKSNVLELLEQVEGEMISECVIPEIAYHALLVNAPINVFNDLTENTAVEFLKASDIMFFRPVGQCSVKLNDNLDLEEGNQPEAVFPTLPPVVGLFDGLPVQNHSLLSGRLSIDDPDNFGENYSVENRQHGTAMSSLIVHGDLNKNDEPLKSILYVRPIMKSINGFAGSREFIPENILTIDLIHRAVKRIFDGEGDLPPTAPTIKAINLSIGDPSRVFDNTLSSFAKVIDWLSFKYNVLFIISAGNCNNKIELATPRAELTTLLADPNNLSRTIVAHLHNNLRFNKIISPAESINALSIGASHDDSEIAFIQGTRVNLFQQSKFFSPISRVGLGFRRSIKPDVLMSGGRVLFNEPLIGSDLIINNSRLAPGHKVAAPSPDGNINYTTYTRGTSNSAALTSRTIGKLYESFSETNEIHSRINMESFFSLISKSLIVHSASWDSESQDHILNSINDYQGNPKDLVARFFGYGIVLPERITECTEKRVTLIGTGALRSDEANLFKLPLPVGISGGVFWRSLTVTLSWFSPINPLNQVYRVSKLWYDFPDNSHKETLNVARKFYDNDTVNRGTVQHEIFDGRKASAFVDGTNLNIRVNCKKDAGDYSHRVKYALAVTLEVDDQLDINIYNEIRTKIQQQVQV